MNDLPQIQPLGKITGFSTHHGFHLEQEIKKIYNFLLAFSQPFRSTAPVHVSLLASLSALGSSF